MKNYIKILAVLMVFTLTLAYIPAISAKTIYEMDPDNIYKYEEIVLPKFFDVQETEVRLYRETFEYYSGENKTSTPDYVLIEVSNGYYSDSFTFTLFGNYYISEHHGDYPFLHGYGIFIPKTQEVYDLKTAYDMGIEGIENVFTEAKVGTRLGDVDKDKRITIKDATNIQKLLVGLYDYQFQDDELFWGEDAPLTVFDFNYDRDINIKDATDIQKYLVGLEY